MKILVTGANGFIGSHLVESLTETNHEVSALCEYNFASSYGWLEASPVLEKVQVHLGDIRDSNFIRGICTDVELIINLAALISIPYSYEAPRSNVEVNVMGTINILDASRINNAKVIHVSTSEVYGTPKYVPIREDHEINPQSPYAASKASADFIVQSYNRSFNVRTLTLRPFNTFGPRQSARAVIPTILSQALRGSTIKLGNLEAQRDFTYVSDTVNAFLLALDRNDLFDGNTIHLGYGESIAIRDLVEKISRIIDKPLEISESQERIRPVRSEVEILKSDPSKAKRLLDWHAKVELDQGIMNTWQWMLENQSKYLRYTDYLR